MYVANFKLYRKFRRKFDIINGVSIIMFSGNYMFCQIILNNYNADSYKDLDIFTLYSHDQKDPELIKINQTI